MSANIAQKVQEFITPYAESIGIKIAEVEFAKKANGMNLTVFIYKDEGSVTLEDCEKLHKLIDAPLDILNPTADKPYTLNVSSLGLDRHLKTKNDFMRNLGKILTVNLYAKQQGKKEIEGKLVEYNENSISLILNDGSVREILLSDAAKITQKITV